MTLKTTEVSWPWTPKAEKGIEVRKEGSGFHAYFVCGSVSSILNNQEDGLSFLHDALNLGTISLEEYNQARELVRTLVWIGKSEFIDPDCLAL